MIDCKTAKAAVETFISREKRLGVLADNAGVTVEVWIGGYCVSDVAFCLVSGGAALGTSELARNLLVEVA